MRDEVSYYLLLHVALINPYTIVLCLSQHSGTFVGSGIYIPTWVLGYNLKRGEEGEKRRTHLRKVTGGREGGI